jgi:glycosyltransferase involved in cell wall biosynthesis
VCAVGLRGIPEIMGGIETHCEQLYTELSNEIEDIVILARSPYIKNAFKFKKNVSVIPVFTIRSKILETFLHTLICIFYARLVIKPDVLHIHGIGPALFTPFAKLLGLKVLVTHHGADYNRKKWNWFAQKMLLLGEYFAIRYADVIIVVGATLTDGLKTRYPSQIPKINFIPNGCPLLFLDCDIADISIPSDINVEVGRYILFVGRLVPEKGVHDLINAFSIAALNDIKLLIVGGTDFEDKYSKELLNLAAEKIIFAGRRTGKDLLAIYNSAKLFVLPSYHEGLPIVALEALSLSVPLLLSNISPHLDIGLHADNYFEIGNTHELVKRLKSPVPATIDRDLIVRKYNWSNIAKNTKSLLEKCNG